MNGEEQAETLVELTRAAARIAELRLRVLADADRNQVGARDGAASTAAWLAHTTRETRVAVNRDVRLAKALDEPLFEPLRCAVASGAVTVDQARVIVHVVEDLPEHEVTDTDRVRVIAHLLELAATHDARDLRILGRGVFEVLAPDEADRREGDALEAEELRARERCSFAMRSNGDGTHSGWFRLPDAQADMLGKAVQAFVAPRKVNPDAWLDADGKRRPYRTLLGQGFCELVEHLPVDRLPQSGGLAATIVATLGLEALRTGVGAGVLDTGTRASAGQLRRWSCTAGILPAVLGGASVPLDLGRGNRYFTPGQRVALGIRDKGCTTLGCDRPPGWCEAHHEELWSEGGPTDLANGRLLCPRHHHLAHDPRYETRRHPGNKISFHRRT